MDVTDLEASAPIASVHATREEHNAHEGASGPNSISSPTGITRQAPVPANPDLPATQPQGTLRGNPTHARSRRVTRSYLLAGSARLSTPEPSTAPHRTVPLRTGQPNTTRAHAGTTRTQLFTNKCLTHHATVLNQQPPTTPSGILLGISKWNSNLPKQVRAKNPDLPQACLIHSLPARKPRAASAAIRAPHRDRPADEGDEFPR